MKIVFISCKIRAVKKNQGGGEQKKKKEMEKRKKMGEEIEEGEHLFLSVGDHFARKIWA